jgi:hypothetical protein
MSKEFYDAMSPRSGARPDEDVATVVSSLLSKVLWGRCFAAVLGRDGRGDDLGIGRRAMIFW